MQPTSHRGFAQIYDTAIYHEIAGSGEPVVLVHAGICDSRMWDEQFAPFAQRYQVLRHDMRGYGQSRAVDAQYAHHRDLMALLQQKGIAAAHFVGCSFGGAVCLDFALTYPHMVRSLVLVNAHPSGFRAASSLATEFAAVDAALDQGDFDQAAELEVQMWVDGPKRSAEQVTSSIRERVRAMNIIALRNEVLDLGEPEPLDPPAVERLQDVQTNVLLVAGALDQPRSWEAFQRMRESLPNQQSVVIEETAHLPNMEQPERFNQEVLDFLQSIARERTD